MNARPEPGVDERAPGLGTGTSPSPFPPATAAAAFCVRFIETPDPDRLRRLMRSADFRLWPADAQAAARDAFARVEAAKAS